MSDSAVGFHPARQCGSAQFVVTAWQHESLCSSPWQLGGSLPALVMVIEMGLGRVTVKGVGRAMKLESGDTTTVMLVLVVFTIVNFAGWDLQPLKKMGASNNSQSSGRMPSGQ